MTTDIQNLEEELQLPAILNIPPKLYPIITELDNYRYFLLEGGRGSAKSQSVARELLVFGETEKLRIVCGREIQDSIEESVYTLLVDLIKEHNLNYRVYKTRLVHRKTGTTFTFKGFREQGASKIKGLEGVDILWIDEAQAITSHTLKILIPTIREGRAKVFFTMNRYVVDDPVFVEFADREDCLHIHIDYFENPHCPEVLIHEANICKVKNLEDYLHIWRGIPLKQAQSAAFRNVEGIVDDDLPLAIPADPRFHYVMGADYAKSVDHTVFIVICIELKCVVYFERLENENKASWFYQKQKTLAISREYNNALIVPDSTGVGDPIVEDLERMGGNVYYEETETGKNTSGVKFTGISKENLIDKLKVVIEMGSIQIPRIDILIKELIQFEATKLPSGKFRYAAPIGKDDQGNDVFHDDCVISLALAVWGARDFLYLKDFEEPEPLTRDKAWWIKVKQDIARKKIKTLTPGTAEVNLEDEAGFRQIGED